MLISEYLHTKSNQDFLIKIAKIIILGFVSFSLISNAIPFYLGFDDVNYGIISINLSQGNYAITNELLQETGNTNFIPHAYVKTSNDSAIPKSGVGLNAIGAFSYLIGGFYGLFYFGPIITIVFLIIYERITTKLFGNLVGLIAILFLVADWQFFFVGLRFLTDNIFSLFFILGVFSILKFFQKKDDRYILLCSIFFSISTFFRISGGVFLPAEIIIISGFFAYNHFEKSKKININSQSISIIKLFSKSNVKKFFKVSLLLLIPWIVFLAFWFGSNDYYFGDATTNYRAQVRTGSIDAEDQNLQTIFSNIIIPDEGHTRNEFDRLKLVQYYLVPLMPDPLYFFLIITSDTDLNEWRSDIWISYVTVLVLSISLIMSLYFKILRKETITIIFFIVTIVAFYSSPIVAGSPLAPNLSEHANNRYMIPVSSLSFMLIGFILVGFWQKCLSKNPIFNNKKIKFLKLFYLILVIIFFIALIVTMPPIQDLYQTGFVINDPVLYSKSYEDLEKLPEKSLIIGYNGRTTLLHTDTHFYPYGNNFIKQQGNTTSLAMSKIDTLTRILEDDYQVFAHKSNMFPYDEIFFNYLESDHGIILKDYSKTFCKLELTNNLNENLINVASDPICFKDIQTISKKIWPVTLKWP